MDTEASHLDIFHLTLYHWSIVRQPQVKICCRSFGARSRLLGNIPGTRKYLGTWIHGIENSIIASNIEIIGIQMCITP